ncbi:hypothetical protein DY000_02056784 [Brassica cretica]|uniref:Uncharacterized protein n=1 Tax=Brassica cretica TaxID=69181 RepID=A0ABQ7A8R7_BRACR|nr:hypothetical protein DY000_02056784 [Brassica cretica]
MTKFTTLAIFIVLFPGMVAKETQGQHICRQILLNDNCDGPEIGWNWPVLPNR